MIRENKYLVLKNADIEKHLSDEHQLKLDLFTTKIRIGRLNDGKQDQQYVVVAADWPMYETVWQMVEAFVDGKPNELEISQAENAALKERVVTLEKLQGVALIESLRAEIERLKEAGSIYKNNNIIRQENHSLQQELAALKAELREICAAIDDPAGDLTLTTVECIKKLKAENESLRKDAERLDFILRKQLIVIQDCDDKYFTYNAQSGKRGPEMDSEAEAIDAAIAKGEQ